MNKLILGDCLQELKKIEDCSCDISFTSPPYNRKRNDKYDNYDDSIDDYSAFLIDVIDQMLRVTKRNVFFNIQKNFYNKQDVFEIIGHYSKKICEIFIWEKSNPMPASGKAITNAYEFILVFGENLESNTTYTKNHLTTSVAKMFKNHKAVMHPEVAFFFISNFTNKNDVVLDPFMGTGTTGKVCKELNRSFIGIEIDHEYFLLSKKRINGFSNQETFNFNKTDCQIFQQIDFLNESA